MNADVRAKWIEALESGKYEQGTGELRTESGKYCCLGVLCDIKDPTAWRRADASAVPYSEYAEGCGNTGQVPDSVREWAGLSPDRNDERTLFQMNDIGRLSFSRIAQYIRENL